MRSRFPLRMWIVFSLFAVSMIAGGQAVLGGEERIDPALGKAERALCGVVSVGSFVALVVYLREV